MDIRPVSFIDTYEPLHMYLFFVLLDFFIGQQSGALLEVWLLVSIERSISPLACFAVAAHISFACIVT